VSRRALSVAALVVLACACADERVPLESGDYVSDDLNEPKTLAGVVLAVDLGGGTATLTDGADRVPLALARVRDSALWVRDCATMTGAHTRLEVARVSPTSFTLRGQHFSFDTLQAECGSGVRLTQSSRADDRWLFRRR